MAAVEGNDTTEKTKKTKKKRLRGFPGILWGQLSLLNDNEYFLKNYADQKFDILFICTDEKYAAHFKVDHATADVDAIENKKEELKKLKPKPKGKMVCTFDQFMALASGKIRTKQMIKLMLTRKIKISGFKYFKEFIVLFKIVYKMQKKKLNEMKTEKEEPKSE
jgi:putative sterol carrier protein